ncbi:MAG: immune inhibitor A [Anaerolineales bacterium]|nr:immune inhibitor A [Anaerolineales bacterium]
MKQKVLDITVIFMLVAAFLPVSVAANTPVTPPEQFPRNNMAPAGLDPMDLSVEMLGEDEIAIRKLAAEIGPAVATNASPSGNPATIGENITVTVSDDGLGVDYDETFVVLMDGTHGIILIEKAAYDNYDAAAGEYVFPNPNNCWRPEDRISTTQLAYLLDEFDNTIYPTNTSVFGEPLPRGDEGQKVWILIHNIRDEAFYDCEAESYIAGYFSASEDAENNKNMMHIDSYDWQNRTGPDSDRPFLYEGVFAHEFQHLIHFDMDPDEPSWVDEGLADLAAFLCGYGHSSGHIAYYFVYHPMVSLTFWGNGLEDYGASYLFQLYLYEHFGGSEFVTALVQEQANGIEGVENTLAAFGYSESFNEIFDNWTIANYLDNSKKAGGKYGYDSLELGTEDTWGYSIEYALMNMWWGPPDQAAFTVPSDWFYEIEPQPYTAHYYRFTNEKAATVLVDGDDFSGTIAYSGMNEWYSDADAWAWRSFYQTFDIPASGATLNFQTYYDIEEDWDYGYVEVHDLVTGQWVTLGAADTVNYVAHPQDNPNTPGEREPSAYETAGSWNAFTGYSGGWIPVSMDLSAFAGHLIEIYFTTWQDGAYTLQMMYVDEISIPEIGFLDDVEAGQGDWTSTGWYVTDGILANGISVVTIDTKWVPVDRYPEPAGNNAMTLHSVNVMDVDPETQSGSDRISTTKLRSGRVNVSIVSNHADHILTSSYVFGVH